MSIERFGVGPRMSQVVVHNDTVYVCGQVADDTSTNCVRTQTADTLRKIDERLEMAGTNKSKLLSAQIWVANMALFDEMNAAWDAWVDPNNSPARACVEAKMAAAEYLVEIMVIAAR
tara:strand:- start:320 stop:670 length:351 start_codon:yes stop_codon:yes gene_type:complete